MKFSAIYTTNLDEFFMVRVAGLHDQIDAGVHTTARRRPVPVTDARAGARPGDGADGPRRARTLQPHPLAPALAEHDIRIVAPSDDLGDRRARGSSRRRFEKVIFPALTPLAVAPGRPLSLHLQPVAQPCRARAATPTPSGQTVFARVKVPTEILPRFMPLGDGMTLRHARGLHRPPSRPLFPGTEIIDRGSLRVTRNADLDLVRRGR